jgi:hypothetical protein
MFVSEPLGLSEFLPPSVALVEVVLFCFFFLFFCFVFVGASKGFWFLVRGDRWVLENGRWRCRSKLDLLTSVVYFSTRIFLWRSSAFSGLDGHLAGPCSTLLFGAWSAHAGGLHSGPRACGLRLVFPALQGADLDLWRSSVDEGFPEKSCVLHALVFSAVCFLGLYSWASTCCGCKFFSCFTVYRFSVAALS